MRPTTGRVLILVLPLSVLAGPGTSQDAAGTPAEQYRALRKEYDRIPGGGTFRTDADRLKFVGGVYKHHTAVAQKFLALAGKYPADPVALDALTQAVWQVNTTPWPVDLVGDDPARARAFEILRRDHIRSDKLAPLCQRISYGFAREYEDFLRAAAADSPHPPVRAAATVSLAHFLNSRLQRTDLCRERPDLAAEFAGLYGKEYLAGLLRQDRDTAATEVETLFVQAEGKYAGEKLPGGESVADRAKAALYEVRNLSVGKVAPDIAGEDQDGRRFKLSDYRGKVVLLDFWSHV